MASFLDKLGDMAKNAADKTNDMIEISKLNSKISTEKQEIQELKIKIGSFIYSSYLENNQGLPAEAAELCLQINNKSNTILQLQQEIDSLKSTGDTKAVNKCPNCSEPISPETKFCPGCGGKL